MMKNNTRVRIVDCEELTGRTGTVKGIVFDNIIKIYIILLDAPVIDGEQREWDCVSIPSGCLELCK